MAWYMSPGTRRYLNQDESLNTLGFRLAMPVSVPFVEESKPIQEMTLQVKNLNGMTN